MLLVSFLKTRLAKRGAAYIMHRTTTIIATDAFPNARGVFTDSETEERREKREDSRQKTEAKTEDRRQKTEDRRQKTEDRRQKTEDRRQNIPSSSLSDQCFYYSSHAEIRIRPML